MGHQVTFAPADQQLVRRGVDERSNGGRDREGYRTWGPDRPTVVYVASEAIGLTIFEMSEPAEVRYIDGRYVQLRQVPIEKRLGANAGGTWTHVREMPSGKICVRASSPYGAATCEKQWREAKRGEIVAKLPEIVDEIEAAASVIAKLVEDGEQQAEEQRREWERQREKWEREERERQRAFRVKASTDDLIAVISAWTFANNVHAFFNDAERRADSLDGPDREAFVERLRRARELVRDVDAADRLLNWKAPDER